jgi:orotate phosphoribosyltransferase
MVGVKSKITTVELVRVLKDRSVRTGNFTLASGKKSTYYVDARLTTMSPEGMVLIGPLAIEMFKTRGWTPDSVGGLTLGADPVAFAISRSSVDSERTIRAFTVRKEAKAHGMGNRIEGPFHEGDRVIVVEDVITTGKSALQAIEALEEAGAVILGVLAVVDREDGGREAIGEKGYDVVALTRISQLLE